MTPWRTPSRAKNRGVLPWAASLGLLVPGLGHRSLGGDKLEIAACQGRAVPPGRQAVARQGPELRDGLGRDARRLPPLENGPGQGVLALLLQGIGQGQQLLLRHAPGGQQVGDPGLAPGDGAGLVQGHNVHLAGLLQGDGGFK